MTLDELLSTYGNPRDALFEAKQIVMFPLPYPMLFGAGDGAAMVTRARCHRLAVGAFVSALETIKDLGLVDEASEFGGILANRSIRGFAGHLSAHAWGLAIDLNESRLPLGSSKNQHPGVVKAFCDNGFKYGGNFKSRRDPMHFSLTGF